MELASKSTAQVQFRDYTQPVGELAWVGAAVICLWDGSTRDSFRWFIEPARLEYMDFVTHLPSDEDKLDELIAAKQRLLSDLNLETPSLKGLEAIKLPQLLSMDDVKDRYHG